MRIPAFASPAVLASLLLVLPAVVHAESCETPPFATEWHAPKRFAQSLEKFRLTAEERREVAEVARKSSGGAAHRAAMRRYREDIAAYREAWRQRRLSRCAHVGNGIIGLAVEPGTLDPRYDLSQGNDVVMLRIHYYYTRDHGDAVSMGALTFREGSSTGHWAYRPHELAPGFHAVEVRLAMSNEAPDGYRSDAIQAEMFVHGKSVFHTRLFPYQREWRRRTTDVGGTTVSVPRAAPPISP